LVLLPHENSVPWGIELVLKIVRAGHVWFVVIHAHVLCTKNDVYEMLRPCLDRRDTSGIGGNSRLLPQHVL
jgi:hypothetical protein